MAATLATKSLLQIVKSYDFDGLAEYIVTRHEIIVAEDDVTEMLCYLGDGFTEACHGEHYLDCRLRKILRKLGYFTRMFGEPELIDTHHVWNALHWPWENGLADQPNGGPRWEQKPERDSEPRYTRSRLPKTAAFITPVNAMAFKVAKPPRESKWRPCLTGETIVVNDNPGTRARAYEYAKRHGMKAQIRKSDGGLIEVRFEDPGNGQPEMSA